MQLPQIRLESKMALIDIQQQFGKQEIRQPKADLTIKQPKAEMSIQTTPSKLTIDQTQAWEDMNLMHISKRIKAFAQDGYNAWLEGMERRARQGTELMKIENGGNPIAQQAIINGHDGMKSLGITFIPSHFSVKVNYQPSDIQIQTQANKPIIDVKTNRPEHTYEKGFVDVQMKHYQELEIDFTNLFSKSI